MALFINYSTLLLLFLLNLMKSDIYMKELINTYNTTVIFNFLKKYPHYVDTLNQNILYSKTHPQSQTLSYL